MTPETISWLAERMERFKGLDTAELPLVNDFAMLWSFFECTKLECSSSFVELGSYVEKKLAELSTVEVDEYLSFLQQQYVDNGQFTQSFHGLNFPYTPREVDNALRGENPALDIKFKACLMILSRYRHNLFHGEAWLEGVHDNPEVFQQANGFLKEIMR